jgi:hypothetical protein
MLPTDGKYVRRLNRATGRYPWKEIENAPKTRKIKEGRIEEYRRVSRREDLQQNQVEVWESKG